MIELTDTSDTGDATPAWWSIPAVPDGPEPVSAYDNWPRGDGPQWQTTSGTLADDE